MRDDITFIKGQGASGRQAAGEDFISGLLLYSATLPSGFTTTNRIKKFYSIVDAENAGIVKTYSDETPATAVVTVSSAGVTGNAFTLNVLDPITGITTKLGTYTNLASDTTSTVVTGMAAIINAGTQNHGYAAVAGTTGPYTVTISAKSGYGKLFNGGTFLTQSTSGIIATLAQFTGGVGSLLAVWHYHISEFFRGNPAGQLFVGIFAVPSSYTFSEITTMQNFAVGKLRQIGIFKNAVYSNADLTAINLEITTNDDAYHAPLSALYAGDLTATTDITTLPDLSVLSANKATSIIGQDGGALGSQLYGAYGKSITQLGIALGLLSLSSVSEDFGNVIDKFNLSNGTENDVPAFANGQLLSALSSNALDAIDAKRHVFGQKYVGNAGTYFNDNHTSISISSDYAYINDNRVIDKACRGIYSTVLPTLKVRLLKNADGTLATSTINYICGLALKPLYQMQRDGDLSVVSKSDVYIDPTQNVTMTSKLVINVVLNEDGIARNISIPISFK
jgi:hypothetical protein